MMQRFPRSIEAELSTSMACLAGGVLISCTFSTGNPGIALEELIPAQLPQ